MRSQLDFVYKSSSPTNIEERESVKEKKNILGGKKKEWIFID